jgi:hypothetical protein
MTTAEAPARPASPTERAVAEMLIENTGSHFLDSGMYGRAWQTTRARYGLDGGLPNSAFSGGPGHNPEDPREDEIERVALAMRDEPEGRIDKYGSFSRSTFHFLVEALDYDEALDRKFQRWTRVTNFGKDDKDWGLSLMQEFPEQLAKRAKITGIYGDGGAVSENTYNGESAIDRTLQFTLFSVENEGEGGFLPDDSYVLLQVHGGADVRGGYTEPRLFRQSSNGEYEILSSGRAYLSCAGNPAKVGQLDLDGKAIELWETIHRWDSENGGSSFNLDGMWGRGETVMRFDDYDSPNVYGRQVKAIYDEARDVWLCPIEDCGAVLG